MMEWTSDDVIRMAAARRLLRFQSQVARALVEATGALPPCHARYRRSEQLMQDILSAGLELSDIRHELEDSVPQEVKDDRTFRREVEAALRETETH